jgi:ribulose-5-phosphate 4-epimerase/fuculose-1-phosphate aldolase
LGEEFAKAMGDKPACLMRGHGITSAGPNVQEATLTAIKLNDAATVNYQASLLGTVRPIPQEDIDIMVG